MKRLQIASATEIRHGICPYLAQCPDTFALERSFESGVVDENRANQSYELCNHPAGGRCLQREEFERNVGKK